MTETETRSVRTRDGRTLCVRVGRGEAERSVLVMHGMPGSGLLYQRWSEDAAARGIRLVSYDRPGGMAGRARVRVAQLLIARSMYKLWPMTWASSAWGCGAGREEVRTRLRVRRCCPIW